MSFSSPLRLISKPFSSAKLPSWLKTAYLFLIKMPSSFEAGMIIAFKWIKDNLINWTAQKKETNNLMLWKNAMRFTHFVRSIHFKLNGAFAVCSICLRNRVKKCLEEKLRDIERHITIVNTSSWNMWSQIEMWQVLPKNIPCIQEFHD